ncbi:MAG TPA: hypothetical protein DDX54_06740 [Rhodospirillaceae bacterium]|jgi:hypothetical protein|nr:hypothetical protein [Alphaproteobacteria bacterium]HBH27080.1 hypothetical protein [Rhodospirillaceae bacterium]
MTDTPKASPAMREQLLDFLPNALETALTAYTVFADKVPMDPESPGLFKAHYDALRVAVAHMELLTKLAAWADLPDPADEKKAQHAHLAVLMARSHVEMDGFNKRWGALEEEDPPDA